VKQSTPTPSSNNNSTSSTNSMQSVSDPPAIVVNPVQSVSTASAPRTVPSDSNSQPPFKPSNVRIFYLFSFFRICSNAQHCIE
jgi:hypothetical protein